MWKVPELMAIEEVLASGAATSVYAALSREWEGKGGIFLSNCVVIGSIEVGR